MLMKFVGYFTFPGNFGHPQATQNWGHPLTTEILSLSYHELKSAWSAFVHNKCTTASFQLNTKCKLNAVGLVLRFIFFLILFGLLSDSVTKLRK
jgi:hypothetical protein